MELGIRGKTALVTGASMGIGKGIATALAREGVRLAVVARRRNLLEELQKELGQKLVIIERDLMEEDSSEKIAQAALDGLGSVDILINNAGGSRKFTLESSEEQWEEALTLNFTRHRQLTHKLLPHMIARKWGRIINVASAHGLVASPFKSAYVAAKHGLVGLTKTVALETAGTGVTCNAICPGYVLTPLVEKQIEDQSKGRNISREAAINDVILERQPSKEFVKVDEIAALAVFLAGDDAASITGAAYSIDGGWTAQ